MFRLMNKQLSVLCYVISVLEKTTPVFEVIEFIKKTKNGELSTLFPT
jgi:hypothetical protein